MSSKISRRTVIARGVSLAAGSAGASALGAWSALAHPFASDSRNAQPTEPAMKFDISLAAWSVHRMFYDGKLKQLDMPQLCRKELDIGGLELVNSFFASPQQSYLDDLLKRAADHGVKILLIMCDGEGDMSSPDARARFQAVRNHKKWVDIAAYLGCHSIRCNSGGTAKDADSIKRCADSFSKLVEYARPDKLNVIVENHGGVSRDPDSMLEVIRLVNDPAFGVLPDFGNFPAEIDRYDAVRKWMPHAKAVSAKCHDFDEKGNETHTDYFKMMKIVTDAGYHGWVGIEYEGGNADELAGVRACKQLLLRCRDAG